MISAIEVAHQHRARTKSAASGAPFSMPALLGVAGLAPVIPQTGASSGPVCQTSPTPAVSPSLNLSSFLGRAVGSGQCVALVRAAQPALGPSANWSPGAAVQGNTALPPGTPIATFDPASHYANNTDGSSHAAIYLGQDSRGVQVMDQWVGSAAAIRTIPWSNPGAALANVGTAFRVVKPGEA